MSEVTPGLVEANRAIADARALYERWQRQIMVAANATPHERSAQEARARAYGYEYDRRWDDVLNMLPALRAWEEDATPPQEEQP